MPSILLRTQRPPTTRFHPIEKPLRQMSSLLCPFRRPSARWCRDPASGQRTIKRSWSLAGNATEVEVSDRFCVSSMNEQRQHSAERVTPVQGSGLRTPGTESSFQRGSAERVRRALLLTWSAAMSWSHGNSCHGCGPVRSRRRARVLQAAHPRPPFGMLVASPTRDINPSRACSTSSVVHSQSDTTAMSTLTRRAFVQADAASAAAPTFCSLCSTSGDSIASERTVTAFSRLLMLTSSHLVPPTSPRRSSKPRSVSRPG